MISADDERESVPKREEEESQNLSTESKPSSVDQIDNPVAESTTTTKSPKEPTKIKTSHKTSSETHSGTVGKKQKKESKSKPPATKKPKPVGIIIIILWIKFWGFESLNLYEMERGGGGGGGAIALRR